MNVLMSPRVSLNWFGGNINKTLLTLKILLTGPESSGKTTLAAQLAQHFACPWQPEYAREYLSELDRDYNKADLNIILQEQTERRTIISDTHPPMLICDTGPEVIYIWSKVKYREVDPFIISQLKDQHYDLRLICYPDLAWEADPLREAPNQADRLILWQEYVALHEQFGWDYHIIRGEGTTRLAAAIEKLNSYLGTGITLDS